MYEMYFSFKISDEHKCDFQGNPPVPTCTRTYPELSSQCRVYDFLFDQLLGSPLVKCSLCGGLGLHSPYKRQNLSHRNEIHLAIHACLIQHVGDILTNVLQLYIVYSKLVTEVTLENITIILSKLLFFQTIESAKPTFAPSAGSRKFLENEKQNSRKNYGAMFSC